MVEETHFHKDTIIDGELVIDTLENGTTQVKYLVFDCMYLDNINLMHRSLDKRLAYFTEHVFKPYEDLYKKYPDEVQHLPFIMECKTQLLAYGMQMMFLQELGKLKHGNDGLIFTCRSTEYHPGTDPHILKWKPANENSIDFKLSFDFHMLQPDDVDRAEGINQPYPDYDTNPICNLLAWNGSSPNNPQHEEFIHYGILSLTDLEWTRLKSLNEPLNDRIVECYMDTNKQWRFMRFRDDKEAPNHISTVTSVIESIRDGVTEQDLIKKAGDIRTEWKRREKERNDKQKREEMERRERAAREEAERRERAAREKGMNGVNGNVVAGQKRMADDQGPVRPSPGPPGIN